MTWKIDIILTSYYGVMTSYYGVMTSYYGVMTSYYGVMTSYYGVMTSYYDVMTSYYGVMTSYYGVMTSYYGVMTSYYGVTDVQGMLCKVVFPRVFNLWKYLIFYVYLCTAGIFLTLPKLPYWLFYCLPLEYFYNTLYL